MGQELSCDVGTNPTSDTDYHRILMDNMKLMQKFARKTKAKRTYHGDGIPRELRDMMYSMILGQLCSSDT